MTREEAIERMEMLRQQYEVALLTTQAIDMAINALQTEGVGRYEKAMQKLREMPKYLSGVKEKQIKKIPSEVVQGTWIDVENEPYCECSVCGAYIDNLDDDYAFCPRCGADMRGDRE